jgi:hypothetical protein
VFTFAGDLIDRCCSISLYILEQKEEVPHCLAKNRQVHGCFFYVTVLSANPNRICSLSCSLPFRCCFAHLLTSCSVFV